MSSARDYAGDGIVVHWRADRCIHTEACVRGLPAVFDPQRRPWIDASAAGAVELAEVVRRCPTGALTYTPSDPDVPVEAYDEVEVAVVPGGPLVVRGPIRLSLPDGDEVDEPNRTALCRCGGSATKPWCDGAHRTNGFEG